MKPAHLRRHGRLLCILASLLTFAVSLHAAPQDHAKITMEFENVTLEQAVTAIRQQTQYLFFDDNIDFSRKVSISVKDETIDNVCRKLFDPLDIEYKIEGNYIYLSNKPEEKPVTVSGTVLDPSGNPVPGAAVLESGTSNGTMTDLDGCFTLTVSGGAAQ